MRVLKDYILVEEPIVEEKKSEGGIILAQDRVDYTSPITNKVLAVGSNVKDVKEGDEIIYLARAGIEFKHDNHQYRVIKEEDIVLVLS